MDSATSVFVASNDTAVKKSVWLVRRALVLQDGVSFDEIAPFHISEADMVADPFTKYLVYPVWARHMWYLLNKLGSTVLLRDIRKSSDRARSKGGAR